MKHALQVTLQLPAGSGSMARGRLAQALLARQLEHSAIEEHELDSGETGVTLQIRGNQADRDGIRATVLASVHSGTLQQARRMEYTEHECTHGEGGGPCTAAPPVVVDFPERRRRA